ncbi:MAG: hypothetical protein KC547_08035 [Anaerolineae bacterium]|nr:hypothetical protein [Anaerolineae bacterium]
MKRSPEEDIEKVSTKMADQPANRHTHEPAADDGAVTTTNQELPPTQLDREDNRWGPHHWLRDWAILLTMILIYLVWTGIIYLLEPGIR